MAIIGNHTRAELEHDQQMMYTISYSVDNEDDDGVVSVNSK